MTKPIFVSFRYSDIALRNDLLAMAKSAGFDPVCLEENIGSQGECAIEAEILRRLRMCRGLIVLVGRDAHNSPWLDYEVQAARSAQLECIATRHPTSTGGLPNAHKGLTVIEWSPFALRDAIKAW